MSVVYQSGSTQGLAAGLAAVDRRAAGLHFQLSESFVMEKLQHNQQWRLITFSEYELNIKRSD
jgi:hypothetical protein